MSYIDENGLAVLTDELKTYIDDEIASHSGGGGGTVAPDYVSFYGCDEESLDLTWLDTSNVTYMSLMFYGCPSLTTLNLRDFDTSNVTGMSSMFEECASLISLDLSSFDTSNVRRMDEMFSGCTSLQTLDIRNFDFTNYTSYDAMFMDVPSTCVIYVNQAAYDFIAADFNDQNTMVLTSLSMLSVVSNS